MIYLIFVYSISEKVLKLQAMLTLQCMDISSAFVFLVHSLFRQTVRKKVEHTVFPHPVILNIRVAVCGFKTPAAH